MARVKRGMTASAKHKKVLSLARGFRGRSSSCFRPAIERLEKSWLYAYRDRRNKKREIRALWIQRINAAAREFGMKYSTFIGGLAKASITVDRKILAKFAVENPDVLKELVARIQETNSLTVKRTASRKSSKKVAVTTEL
ncbi:MAG: 50S ribosomal protein L20 [Holosporales bacterium]|jgi:large subunit ribosomal protein L20|nr:50S ribosomal protein L20 [Holosporales bacterium]